MAIIIEDIEDEWSKYYFGISGGTQEEEEGREE